MKKIYFIFAFVALSTFAISCSSDDGGSSSNSSSLTVNGSNVSFSNVLAQKSENSLAIIANASDGASIQILFNKFGNLESVTYDDADFNSYYNYQHYKSNYFTFNLVSINESNKRVKIDYSGTLYEDETDLNSNSITVSGSFDVNYIVQTPAISGLGVTCKIGGSNWYATDGYTNNGIGFDDFILRELSDDQNMISLGFNSVNNGPGTYIFTSSTNTNFAHLSKFNTTTLEYVDYNCVGSIVVTSKTSAGFIGYFIEGTYSFTATNPTNSSDVIQVTNGVFKEYYSW